MDSGGMTLGMAPTSGTPCLSASRYHETAVTRARAASEDGKRREMRLRPSASTMVRAARPTHHSFSWGRPCSTSNIW